MFRQLSKIPSEIGHFRLAKPSEHPDILKLLSTMFPFSRKMHETLKLMMITGDNLSQIYVPKTDHGNNYSGIFLSLFMIAPLNTTNATFVSKEEDAEKTCQLVAESLDWNQKIILPGANPLHVTLLNDTFRRKNHSPTFYHGLQYHLFDENLVDQIQTESGGVHAKTLESKFAKLVFDHWKYKDEMSIHWITHQCEKGLAAGTFIDGREEPVCWTVLTKYGAIGLMHTLQDHRNKGYGLLSTKFLLGRVKEIGLTPYLYVDDGNVKSTNMVKKMGFRSTNPVCWVESEPLR